MATSLSNYRVYILDWDFQPESKKSAWIEAEDQVAAVARRMLELKAPSARCEGIGGFAVQLWNRKYGEAYGEKPIDCWIFDEQLRPVSPSQIPEVYEYHAYA